MNIGEVGVIIQIFKYYRLLIILCVKIVILAEWYLSYLTYIFKILEMDKKFFFCTFRKNQQSVKVYFCLLMRRGFVAPITEVQRLVDS